MRVHCDIADPNTMLEQLRSGFGPVAAAWGISWQLHHASIPTRTPQTKDEAEARLRELVDDLGVDVVVLARYMQIISGDLCKRLDGRAINIHRSSLPSFRGAKTYHQAHGRGVKLVGAMAHYVTPDLDEGPIIEQGVVRVDHAHDPDELVTVGRKVEAQVLTWGSLITALI
ncbi:hypothetical protein DDE74_02175 [Streptomyces lydicus]|uniref:Formyl transferase N-terminal domain-containing protein n=1 Tax=Streptomyces lydicus TaxID=47763 RepID=A0A3Q9K6J6_9ACTN|nr:hypothetical protein DDE74_02175 [Streptomyces lydicus]